MRQGVGTAVRRRITFTVTSYRPHACDWHTPCSCGRVSPPGDAPPCPAGPRSRWFCSRPAPPTTTSRRAARCRLPSNLFYEVTSGGPATVPVATLLEWDQVNDGSVSAWNVYSRSNTAQAFLLRGTTTSNSFHDQGVPELQYYVTAVDFNGLESLRQQHRHRRRAADACRPSRSCSPPASMARWHWRGRTIPSRAIRRASATTACSARRTTWTRTCASQPGGCSRARPWLRSSSPAHSPNGQPRCFGVSAVTIEGFESLWSPIVHRHAAPRCAQHCDRRDAVQPGPERLPLLARPERRWPGAGSRTGPDPAGRIARAPTSPSSATGPASSGSRRCARRPRWRCTPAGPSPT